MRKRGADGIDGKLQPRRLQCANDEARRGFEGEQKLAGRARRGRGGLRRRGVAPAGVLGVRQAQNTPTSIARIPVSTAA